MKAESIENAASISKAAKQLGVDSFSLYGLIQRDKVRPRRERWGEVVVLQIDVDNVLKKPAVPQEDKKEAEQVIYVTQTKRRIVQTHRPRLRGQTYAFRISTATTRLLKQSKMRICCA